eukprot:7036637-Prymnesium_polylepis.1
MPSPPAARRQPRHTCKMALVCGVELAQKQRSRRVAPSGSQARHRVACHAVPALPLGWHGGRAPARSLGAHSVRVQISRLFLIFVDRIVDD